VEIHLFTSSEVVLLESARTPTKQNDFDRLKQDQAVEGKREVLDIEQIVLELLLSVFDGRSIVTRYLCPSRYSWADCVS
jgi:hypothetical protein